MKKDFMESRGNKRKEQGHDLIDITLDKKSLHFLYQALAKYAEFIDNETERQELTLLVDELNEIKDELVNNKVKKPVLT